MRTAGPTPGRGKWHGSGLTRVTRYRLPTQTVRTTTLTQLFDKHGIDCADLVKIDIEGYEHEAVFTAEQALKICGHIPGVHCKNLFLKDKDGALWLVTLPDEKKADLKALPQRIGSKRLSFGNAALCRRHWG